MGNELTSDFHPNITKITNSIINLKIMIPSNSYLIGNIIDGIISINLREPIRLKNITIYLNQNQGWEINENKKSSSNIEIASLNINLFNIAKNNENLYIMEKGNYQFKFSLKIPNNILPSFLFFRGLKIGFIKYSLLAEINTDLKNEFLDEKIIVINMSNESIVDKQFPFEVSKNIKMLFVDYGTNIIKINMNKGIYNYNDGIKFKIQINNKNCTATIRSIHFEIYRKVIFFSKNFREESNEEQKLNEGDFIYEIKPNEIKNFEITLYTQGKIIEDYLYFYSNKIKNSLFNGISHLINYMLPSITTSEYIKCEYKINLSLKYVGIIPDDENDRVTIPLILSSFHEGNLNLNNNNLYQFQYSQMNLIQDFPDDSINKNINNINNSMPVINPNDIYNNFPRENNNLYNNYYNNNIMNINSNENNDNNIQINMSQPAPLINNNNIDSFNLLNENNGNNFNINEEYNPIDDNAPPPTI